jgi:starch synthase (maltosyl-transferring)
MERWPDRSDLTEYDRVLPVQVDRVAARFAAWYELFPRSMSDDPDRHGTFDDVIAQAAVRARHGLRRALLPPIHPIGRTHRKGKNNTLTAGPGEPGSPYAIGGEEGGHKAVHPELGTLGLPPAGEGGAEHGLEIALDFAIQVSPDHPYVKEHPSGSSSGRTAPSSTPRTRPRSTRTSTRSTSTARTGRSSGRSGSRSSSSGSSRG